jgi:putative DNA primase/helicase
VIVMSDFAVNFLDAMRAGGIFPKAGNPIIADGRLHRAPAADDKHGAKSIWYNLHPDAPASGAGGNWRTGARVKWCSKSGCTLTPAERETLKRRIEIDRQQAEAERDCRHKEAAQRAARIWASALPAAAGHPYLTRKAITPGIARATGGALILPIIDFGGALYGLQFIDAHGAKRFISGMAKAGHFVPVGPMPDGSRPLWIAEGWATACTLATMRPTACVIAGLDAGNLGTVAIEARRRWPGAAMVIAPDFDAVGRKKGLEAAQNARARILPPPPVVPPGATDWNDVAVATREARHG